MGVRKRRSRGLSLIEIVFSIVLVVVLATVGLSTLKPAQSRAPARGLATALQEEFSAARELSISQGRPVALGIPTENGTVARASSIYRLEGWNRPTVTWSKGFSGDYPNTVFMPCRWAGPTFGPLALSPLSKFNLFQLDNWLPDEFENDYIYCFLPDGGLVTNNLPATDGRYTLVVANTPNVSGSPPQGVTIDGAPDAVTLLISPSGAVDSYTGLPGGSLGSGAGGSAQSSAPQARTDHAGGGATVVISEIMVRPNPALAPPGQGICVPGQFVTLELYAYDPEGRALFSKWTQQSIDTPTVLGTFTTPDSAGINPNLPGEVDKMEFTYDIPPGLVWQGPPPAPGTGVFRARWSWTVPITSEPGHRYTVQADVRDVNGEVQISNPAVIAFQTPPASGRIISERRDPTGTRWQLVIMNPDGSGERVLSPPGVEEVMPTLDRSATKLACLQGTYPNRYVRVRNINGGGEIQIAGPGAYTSVSISPDGAWVSYRDNSGAGTLHTTKVDGSKSFPKTQTLVGSGPTVKKSRSGWSQDSRYLIYEHADQLFTVDLLNPAANPPENLLLTPINNSGVMEQPLSPTTYMTQGGRERVLVSLGNIDPVLVSFEVTAANYAGTAVAGGVLGDYLYASTGPKLKPNMDGSGPGGSQALDDDYPNVSSNSEFLILTRSAESATATGEDADVQRLLLLPRDGENFRGPPIMDLDGNFRRAIWIPDEE